MKDKYILHGLEVARLTAKMSYATRLKVGAVLIKDDHIIAQGYNGTLPGSDNTCEIESGSGLVTKHTVFHAEQNLLLFCLRSHIDVRGSVMIVTHAPCLSCSKWISGSGISQVIYDEVYTSSTSDGLAGCDFLRGQGMRVFDAKSVFDALPDHSVFDELAELARKIRHERDSTVVKTYDYKEKDGCFSASMVPVEKG